MSKISVKNYISSLYQNYTIIKREEFIKNTSLDFFCPVIDTSVAIFLRILLKAIRPKKVLELGTSIGYSTTIIAETIAEWGGTVTTIELDKKVALAAKENFEKYNVLGNITLINDSVFDVLPKIEEKFDLVFLDLFNNLYPDVMDSCINSLDQGGVLIADDTLFPALERRAYFVDSNKKVDEFNRRLSEKSNVESILLPFDDGITIAIKKIISIIS